MPKQTKAVCFLCFGLVWSSCGKDHVSKALGTEEWCRGPDSNRHASFEARDFKSLGYPSSAIHPLACLKRIKDDILNKIWVDGFNDER